MKLSDVVDNKVRAFGSEELYYALRILYACPDLHAELFSPAGRVERMSKILLDLYDSDMSDEQIVEWLKGRGY